MVIAIPMWLKSGHHELLPMCTQDPITSQFTQLGGWLAANQQPCPWLSPAGAAARDGTAAVPIAAAADAAGVGAFAAGDGAFGAGRAEGSVLRAVPTPARTPVGIAAWGGSSPAPAWWPGNSASSRLACHLSAAGLPSVPAQQLAWENASPAAGQPSVGTGAPGVAEGGGSSSSVVAWQPSPAASSRRLPSVGMGAQGAADSLAWSCLVESPGDCDMSLCFEAGRGWTMPGKELSAPSGGDASAASACARPVQAFGEDSLCLWQPVQPDEQPGGAVALWAQPHGRGGEDSTRAHPHGQPGGAVALWAQPHGPGGGDSTRAQPHGQPGGAVALWAQPHGPGGEDSTRAQLHRQPGGAVALWAQPHGQAGGEGSPWAQPHGQPGGAVALWAQPRGPGGEDSTRAQPHGQPGGAVALWAQPHGQPGGAVALWAQPHGPGGEDSPRARPHGQLGGAVAPPSASAASACARPVQAVGEDSLWALVAQPDGQPGGAVAAPTQVSEEAPTQPCAAAPTQARDGFAMMSLCTPNSGTQAP